MYKIRISDYPAPYTLCHSEASVDSREEAIAYLWALTIQDIPQYGTVWLPMGIEPMTNLAMFRSEPPPSMQDQIDKIVKTLNEPDIESLVVQGLNAVYEGLMRHSRDPDFVTKIEDAAREWAKECFQ